MRIAVVTGRFKDDYYKDGEIDFTKAQAPSLWRVALQFGRENSDRAFFYYVCFRKVDKLSYSSDNPYGLSFLPLKGIRGCLMVFDVKHTVAASMMDVLVPGLETALNFFLTDSTVTPIDAMVLLQVEVTEKVKHWLSCPARPDVRPLIAVRTCTGVMETGGKLRHSPILDDLFYNCNYMQADLVLTNGPHMAPEISKLLMQDFAASKVLKASKRFHYVPHGAPLYSGPLSFKRGTKIGYYGRIHSENNTERVLSVYDKLFRRGIVSEVFLTTGRALDNSSMVRTKFPSVNVKVCGPAEYLEQAKQCRTVLSILHNSGLPLTVLELMSVGVVPVVLKSNLWASYFFPKYIPDYPFMANDLHEAESMLVDLLRYDTLYEKWAKVVVEVANANFNVRDTKRKMFDVMLSEANAMPWREALNKMTLHEAETKFKFLPRLLGMMETKPEWSLVSLLKEANKNKITWVTPMGVPIVSRIELMLLLEKAGWIDACVSNTITLRRPV